MPTVLNDVTDLWNKGRYYQAIALLGENAEDRNTLPPVDAEIFDEIRSAAMLEAAWLDHLLTGSEDYDDEEVALILAKRLWLSTVSGAMRCLDLDLDLPLDEIDQSIRNRFAARRMEPVSRRIYHTLYLTR